MSQTRGRTSSTRTRRTSQKKNTPSGASTSSEPTRRDASRGGTRRRARGRGRGRGRSRKTSSSSLRGGGGSRNRSRGGGGRSSQQQKSSRRPPRQRNAKRSTGPTDKMDPYIPLYEDPSLDLKTDLEYSCWKVISDSSSISPHRLFEPHGDVADEFGIRLDLPEGANLGNTIQLLETNCMKLDLVTTKRLNWKVDLRSGENRSYNNIEMVHTISLGENEEEGEEGEEESTCRYRIDLCLPNFDELYMLYVFAGAMRERRLRCVMSFQIQIPPESPRGPKRVRWALPDAHIPYVPKGVHLFYPKCWEIDINKPFQVRIRIPNAEKVFVMLAGKVIRLEAEEEGSSIFAGELDISGTYERYYTDIVLFGKVEGSEDGLVMWRIEGRRPI